MYRKILAYILLVGLFLGFSATGVLADGTETLGTPSISIASGSGVIAKGRGLMTQPGTININVPSDVNIKQVLLYWEGQHITPNGDNTINANGNIVTGKLIGGPTNFFFGWSVNAWVKSSTYRADITNLGIVHAGTNIITVKGLSFGYRNNGAGILIIFEKGPNANIQLRDGNDLAFKDFAPPLDTTVAQTFKFDPVGTDRMADLTMFFSSVRDAVGFHPTVIEITVNGVVTGIVDALNSGDGLEWDTLIIPVKIPAGASSVSVRALSVSDTTLQPASLAWTVATLSVPKEIQPSKGRMTGGGSVFKGNVRVTHGFEIHCDLKKPNNIEVNWPGNKFHMKDLTSAVCTDDPGIDPKPPKAPFDTFTGTGNGKLNGVNGAKIEFVFTDAGEPGTKDRATMKIWDKSNKLVLDVSGFLYKGNHQAHK